MTGISRFQSPVSSAIQTVAVVLHTYPVSESQQYYEDGEEASWMLLFWRLATALLLSANA